MTAFLEVPGEVRGGVRSRNAPEQQLLCQMEQACVLDLPLVPWETSATVLRSLSFKFPIGPRLDAPECEGLCT